MKERKCNNEFFPPFVFCSRVFWIFILYFIIIAVIVFGLIVVVVKRNRRIGSFYRCGGSGGGGDIHGSIIHLDREIGTRDTIFQPIEVLNVHSKFVRICRS